MKRLKKWKSDNILNFDTAMAFILIVFAVILGQTHPSFVKTLLSNNRSGIYGILTATFGALLGFIITTTSIVIGYSKDDSFFFLRTSRQYKNLWNIFKSAIRWLAYSTIVALLAFLVDRDSAPNIFFMYAALSTTLISTFRIYRCIWIFEKIINKVAEATKIDISQHP